MKAPPTPPSTRRVGIVQPPPPDQIDGAPHDPPSPETTTMNGDSNVALLLDNTHHNNLVSEHQEAKSEPLLVKEENTDPLLVNSAGNDPKMTNNEQYDPKLVIGEQSDPINLVNGEQKLVNGGLDSSTVKVTLSDTEKIWKENNKENLILANSNHNNELMNPDSNKTDNNGPQRIAFSELNELNKINSSQSEVNNLQVNESHNNRDEKDRLGVGGSSEMRSMSPKPFPSVLKRKVSRDCLFFFPEPRRVVGEGGDLSSVSSPSSSVSSRTQSAPASRKVSKTEKVEPMLPEGNEDEDDENTTTTAAATATGDVGDDEVEQMSRKLGEMSPFVRQHLIHVENRFFDMFGDKDKQTININKFLTALAATGMRPSDPRLKETYTNLKKVQEKMASNDLQTLDTDYDTFMSIICENLEVLVKAFSSSFIIPDFRGFCHHLDQIYNSCKNNTNGKVASYIPQLARLKSEHWAVSVCTVDGQRYSNGDVNVPFTLQSCSYVMTYAMVLGLLGAEEVHSRIGMEPSGRQFNELCLDYNNKPHNPMINAGAIMTAALVKPNLSAADRFDFIFNMYKRLAGDEFLGFNNAVFLSEKECADRNFALAYFMRENKCFPEGTRLHETLDFYFQLCSMEITAESGAVMAATLANGGINPLTGDPVLTIDAVRNTLTLMHSCGMYNYSGQFAFKVGLPSKSGVSGCVLLVIPNTMGICLWSPPLDTNGNSCRGVQFCMELVSRFNFHNFDNLRGQYTTKFDPRTVKAESNAQILFDLLFSTAAGDLSALRRHWLSATDMEAQDYDGRTALHVATSEGHEEIVEYLLIVCEVQPLPKDRWGRTPLDDAISFNHPCCANLIRESCNKKGIEVPSVSTNSNLGVSQ
ncbi:hypothetical protein Pmani_011108 [Petrolisthes manimaculis]|uniref:glutaminase n=2 Tax=Petrolisthes manimaculis TaxID=1843537 RepID=A0AAE1UET6_9EUCA|nr:hypothetical protein Pmani_011108 [Petrolisthes manimaculis]